MLQEDHGEQFEEIHVRSSIDSQQKDDDFKHHTELAIKHLRLTPASATEQREELLQFIAHKERKVRELREELARQEEELRLLKLQWQRDTAEERPYPPSGREHYHVREMYWDSSDSDGLYPSSSDNEGDLEDNPVSNAEDDLKRFVAGLGKGIRGVLGEIQKVAESEKTQGTISSIKSAVHEVKESDRFKETKQKTVNFTTSAWGSISKKFNALANSDAFVNTRRGTIDAVHNAEHTLAEKPASPARQPPPLPARKVMDAGPSRMFEGSQPYKVGDGQNANGGEKYEVVVAGLTDSPEPLTSSSHVIGEDPDLDLDLELDSDTGKDLI